MLYVTVNELRKRFTNCNIYFATSENYSEELYNFHKIYYSELAQKIALEGIKRFKIAAKLLKLLIKDCIKFIIGRKNFYFMKSFELSRFLAKNKINALVDISGFSLSSKWGNYVPYHYIDKIKLAKKYNIPVYLMLQSFGPFDYTPDIMPEIKLILSDILQYPRIIFAREREGFDMLENIFALHNVKLSADLVLQNSGIDDENIFNSRPVLNIPNVDSDTPLAGIVPNMRCLDKGRANHDKIFAIYQSIIKYILSQGFKIVLFRHSREDLEFCRIIKSFFPSDNNIILIDKEFSSLEYNQFVKKFKFLICSRFHGLVHAYKNIVPCIALGWAVKYRELAENLGQQNYIFDITDERTSDSEIITAISQLLNNYETERKIIQENLTRIQQNNCFDLLEKDLKNLCGAK